MKIYSIKKNKAVYGYLLYYEHSDTFYIEIEDGIDRWDAPFIFSPYICNRENFVDPVWSLRWVRSRIVPADRQNLGQILRDNGLEYYDESRLLEICQGRCAQDDFYISMCTQLPEHIKRRSIYRIKDIVPLSDGNILAFFNDGAAKICNPAECAGNDERVSAFLKTGERVRDAEVAAGGYGICWGSLFFLSASAMYRCGRSIPLSYADFVFFAGNRTYSTAEACDRLDCSRQNISDLLERGRIQQIKKIPNNNLFLKQEIDSRLWT